MKDKERSTLYLLHNGQVRHVRYGSFKSSFHVRSQASTRPEIFLPVLEASVNALGWRPPRTSARNYARCPVPAGIWWLVDRVCGGTGKHGQGVVLSTLHFVYIQTNHVQCWR